jgi:tryptophanase/molybdopterin/thiamine biosynthesis adenylyltransferase
MSFKDFPSENPGPSGDYFHKFLNRTIMLLGEEAVHTLRGKTVAIAGCGGHGGAACLTLARTGVGNFILADPKPFDPPDINRQWAATCNTLGRNKAEVYEEILLSINPEIRVKKFCEGVTEENLKEFLSGADLLIDCLDVAVPSQLRAAMYEGARNNGIYCITASMLGFGALITASSPEGMPLEVLGGVEETCTDQSKLPKRLKEVYVPEYIELIEKHLPLHRIPSVAVAPALIAAILSTESILILLGATIPGWRPPICLPYILLVDLFRRNYQVVHISDFIRESEPSSDEASMQETVSPQQRSTPSRLSLEDRRALLATVGYNTNLLPDDAVEVDLITDSWSEIPMTANPPELKETNVPHSSPEQVLHGLYGYRYFIPVFRGRFAEALLAKILFSGGGTVVSNSLFPTTRFHLESNGVKVVELVSEEAYDLRSSNAFFKGDLNLDRFQTMLSISGPEKIAAVYLELCVNALGGHPVSMRSLRAIREITSIHGIPLILDTTRSFENAYLIRERELGFEGRSLVSIVREICSYGDACASSAAKDFQCRKGGFIGTSYQTLFIRIRDLTLGYGDGLSETDRRIMAHALLHSPGGEKGSTQRLKQVHRVWESLRSFPIPVTEPPGGHAVFIDAKAFLPHIRAEQYPTQTLANALFILGGIRAAPNLGSPEQERRGIHLLRLAIPVGRYTDEVLEVIPKAFEAVLSKKDQLKGLRRVGGPPGVVGEFAAMYNPIRE